MILEMAGFAHILYVCIWLQLITKDLRNISSLFAACFMLRETFSLRKRYGKLLYWIDVASFMYNILLLVQNYF